MKEEAHSRALAEIEEAEAGEQKARVDDMQRVTAFFDQDGICQHVMKGPGAPPLLCRYVVEVEEGVGPNDIWFDVEAGKVERSGRVFGLSYTHPVGEERVINIPAGVVAEIAGVRHAGEYRVTAAEAGILTIEYHGRLRGTDRIEFRTYAEERAAAYPTLADQLDALWKTAAFPEGSPAAAMQAEIMAVKAEHPKGEK